MLQECTHKNKESSDRVGNAVWERERKRGRSAAVVDDAADVAVEVVCLSLSVSEEKISGCFSLLFESERERKRSFVGISHYFLEDCINARFFFSLSFVVGLLITRQTKEKGFVNYFNVPPRMDI